MIKPLITIIFLLSFHCIAFSSDVIGEITPMDKWSYDQGNDSDFSFSEFNNESDASTSMDSYNKFDKIVIEEKTKNEKVDIGNPVINDFPELNKPIVVKDLNFNRSRFKSKNKFGSYRENNMKVPYKDIILKYSKIYDINPSIVIEIVRQESAFNRYAKSRAGAMGLMQLMPPLVREYGIDPYNPAQNIRSGTHYIAMLLKRYKDDLPLALAGYNAGMGNVRKYGGIPPFKETQKYVYKITKRLNGIL